MGVSPAASGCGGRVIWAVENSGRSQARIFFDALNTNEQVKIQALFDRFAASGEIKTRERFKKLETRHGWALWEFKSFQIRFIGAFSPDRIRREFVVACGLKKKRDRHKPQDLDKAVRILDEHFSPQPKI